MFHLCCVNLISQGTLYQTRKVDTKIFIVNTYFPKLTGFGASIIEGALIVLAAADDTFRFPDVTR